MGERSLFLRALVEPRDRRPNALINEHHENFFLVAKKNGAAHARRTEAADPHFDNGLTHTVSLVIPFPPRSELLSTGDQKPKPFSFVPLPVKIRSARVSGHRSKGTRVRRPNLHPRMKSPTFNAISCGKSRLERLFFSLVESILFPLT